MAFRNVPDKRFDIEILTIDGTLQWRGSDDPCIQLIIAYLFNDFIGQELFECKIDLGMLQNKIPEKHRDEVGCNCGDNPHPRSEERRVGKERTSSSSREPCDNGANHHLDCS